MNIILRSLLYLKSFKSTGTAWIRALAGTMALCLAVLFSPQSIRACTVCFGGADSDLQRGFFWGIVVLGALPFALLGFFISYVVYHSKKNNPHEKPAP